jgi:hypothetical protein
MSKHLLFVSLSLVFASCTPVDDKYVPTMQSSISTDSINWTISTNDTYAIEVGKIFYLKIAISIKKNGLFTGSTKIPYYIKIPNSDAVDMTVDDALGRIMTSIEDNATNSSSYSLLANIYRKQNESFVVFRSRATKPETMQIAISYGGEISRKYDKTISLVFK